MKEFDSYKINEILEHKYYQIPQELFDNPLYKDNLTSDSKILYAFLLDRLTLSKKNNWIDKDGSIYLIFTRQEVQEKLNLSDKTVTKAFKQLINVNLIYEKSQGGFRSQAIGAYSHNERKTKNHANKNIDITKTELNFYLKKNELSYIKEFDRIKEKHDLKGQIKVTSNILCEMIITSDQKFFDNIGYEETKRYFNESYKFICNYKNLGEQNIVSAVVHMDEDTPHLHLLFIPVVHTTDKLGNKINKVSCRDFWKGKNSYGILQDSFYQYVTSKGFNLERGQPKELTNREHYTMEKYKKITNYENTQKVIQDIKLELPDVPDVKHINKFMLGRDEKIVNEIIKPKDELIEKLYSDNLTLHKELTKQAKVIDKAEKYEKEQNTILAHNQELQDKCKQLEIDYTSKNEELEEKYNHKFSELDEKFENKTIEFKRELRKDYYELEKENKKLRRIVNTVTDTIHKFITWVCKKFAVSVESVVRDFEKENRICLDPIKQIKCEDRQKEDREMEL